MPRSLSRTCTHVCRSRSTLPPRHPPQFLDNTIPGTDAERGLNSWVTHAAEPGARWEWWEDDAMHNVYGLPFGFTRWWERRVGGPLHARASRALAPAAAALAPAARAARAALTCCGHCGPQHGAAAGRGAAHEGGSPLADGEVVWAPTDGGGNGKAGAAGAAADAPPVDQRVTGPTGAASV